MRIPKTLGSALPRIVACRKDRAAAQRGVRDLVRRVVKQNIHRRRCAILCAKRSDLEVHAVARSTAFQDLFLPSRGRKERARNAALPEDNPAFQEIWAVVGAIPRGSVSTYGAVARAAGLPGRARMAGRALRESPKEMKLPWHRVVGAGGKIVFPST